MLKIYYSVCVLHCVLVNELFNLLKFRNITFIKLIKISINENYL